MSQTTWYVNTEGTLRVAPLKILVDEEIKASIDWNAYAGAKSTTAQNVTFESADDGVATISNATLSSGVSTVEVGGNDVGRTTVRAKLGLASGEVLVRKFLVEVTDPFEDDVDGYQ